MKNKNLVKIFLLVMIVVLAALVVFIFSNKESVSNKRTYLADEIIRAVSHSKYKILSKSAKIRFLSNEDFKIVNKYLTISLYNYDEREADRGAILLSEEFFKVGSIPFTISLPYPGDHSNPSNKYYISTEWDANNGGLINSAGDIFYNGFSKIELVIAEDFARKEQPTP